MFIPTVPGKLEHERRTWLVVHPEGLVARRDGERVVFLTDEEVAALGLREADAHRLGTLDETDVLAVPIDGRIEPPLELLGLRALASLLDADLFGVVARAMHTCEWLTTSRSCGRCGTPTTRVETERCMACPSCGLHIPPAPTQAPGKSPWGYETYKEPTPAPVSLRPGEQTLPELPRKYTDIQSYHAHIYFDEDTYSKAALLRKWVSERFHVELGNWNLEPRGPHVTPSFYFGFTNDLLPVILPWLQLNSLGLTILLHPNTEDPRADHLYYALWINRTQPVNAYSMTKPGPGEPPVEQIYPNTKPTVKLEV